MLRSLLLLLALTAAASAHAQSIVDVVYLENGSVIRGTILEQVPGESLRLRTGDGSEFVFMMADVTRIVREQAAPSTVTVTPVAPVVPAAAPPAAAAPPTAFGGAPREIPQVKSSSIATILSVVIAGGGQFYAGETGKGLLLLGSAIAIPYAAASIYVDSALSCTGLDCYEDSTTILYLGYAAGLAIWAYGVFDAAPAARRANRRAAGLAAVAPTVLRDPASGRLAYGASARIRF